MTKKSISHQFNCSVIEHQPLSISSILLTIYLFEPRLTPHRYPDIAEQEH